LHASPLAAAVANHLAELRLVVGVGNRAGTQSVALMAMI